MDEPLFLVNFQQLARFLVNRARITNRETLREEMIREALARRYVCDTVASDGLERPQDAAETEGIVKLITQVLGQDRVWESVAVLVKAQAPPPVQDLRDDRRRPRDAKLRPIEPEERGSPVKKEVRQPIRFARSTRLPDVYDEGEQSPAVKPGSAMPPKASWAWSGNLLILVGSFAITLAILAAVLWFLRR